jgi:hypothetical protein
MKKLILALIVVIAAAFASATPSYAGSIGVYGSYWDGSDVGSSYGAGVRLGFDMFDWMGLEFHGTYYADFEEEIDSEDFELTALPVDGGLRFNLFGKSKFNLYLGAGVTYYFMDTNLGSVDDEFTYYGEVGIEMGGDNTKFFAEALWRDLDTTVDDPSGDEDVSFSGVSLNAGLNWTW